MQTILSKTAYQVQGRHGIYTVTRINKTTWACTCPATVLCHHIKEVIQSEAKGKGFYAQFAKDAAKVQRQHRKSFEITAKGKPAYVVYRKLSDPLAGCIRFCWTYHNETMDFYYPGENGKDTHKSIPCTTAEWKAMQARALKAGFRDDGRYLWRV